MDPSSFLNNPMLNGISPEKLQFLMEMASKDNGTTPKDMADSIMSASGNAKEKGLNFNSAESDLIIEVLKQNMNEKERKKADLLLSFMKNRK